MQSDLSTLFWFAFASASATYIAVGIYSDVRMRSWSRVAFGLFALLLPLGSVILIVWAVALGQGEVTVVKQEVRIP